MTNAVETELHPEIQAIVNNLSESTESIISRLRKAHREFRTESSLILFLRTGDHIPYRMEIPTAHVPIALNHLSRTVSKKCEYIIVLGMYQFKGDEKDYGLSIRGEDGNLHPAMLNIAVLGLKKDIESQGNYTAFVGDKSLVQIDVPHEDCLPLYRDWLAGKSEKEVRTLVKAHSKGQVNPDPVRKIVSDMLLHLNHHKPYFKDFAYGKRSTKSALLS